MKSLSEKGTLNELHKSIGSGKNFCAVDPKLQLEIEVQLKETLKQLYEKILQE